MLRHTVSVLYPISFHQIPFLCIYDYKEKTTEPYDTPSSNFNVKHDSIPSYFLLFVYLESFNHTKLQEANNSDCLFVELLY